MKKLLLIISLLISVNLFGENNTRGFPILTMSKNDEICHHFYKIFNDDMHKHNGYMPNLHEEFTNVLWKKTDIYSKTHIINNIKTAEIDINNDNKKEFVFFRDYSAYSGKYWYETVESIQWFDLSKKELVTKKIEEQNNLMEQLGQPMQFIQTFQTNLELKELPIRKIKTLAGKIKSYYYSSILDYEGLRIAQYKKKYYFVFFGLNKSIDYNPKSQTNKKIKDKTIIVISSYTSKNERQDVCYYHTVK